MQEKQSEGGGGERGAEEERQSQRERGKGWLHNLGFCASTRCLSRMHSYK